MADDLAALIERLDLSAVTLVGHSVGAAEVVRYLTRHGASRVARIVLSAPTTPFLLRTDDNPDGVDEATFEAVRETYRYDLARAAEAGAGPYLGANHEAFGAWARWQALGALLETPQHVLLQTNRDLTRADLRAELPQVSVPALVIQGTEDVSAPIDLTGRRTAGLIPGSRLVAIDGAGHGLYFSDARRYNAELIAFLRAS